MNYNFNIELSVIIKFHAIALADTWYSSLKNLKSIRDHGWVWVIPLRKNRKVNKNVSLESLDIPDEGLEVRAIA